MTNSSLQQDILDELSRLGTEQQQQVLDFARALAMKTPRGVPGRKLLTFAGAIDAGDLQTMSRAIEEDCEKVHLDEW